MLRDTKLEQHRGTSPYTQEHNPAESAFLGDFAGFIYLGDISVLYMRARCKGKYIKANM